MKRFWIDEILYSQRKSWTMTTSKISAKVNLVVLILVFIQIVPSSCIVDKKCNLSVLQPCDENEKCVSDEKGDGVCKCLDGFTPNSETGRCEKPSPSPEPPSSHWGLSLGLGLIFFLVLVVIILTVLHYKFGLLAGICDGLPQIRLFGRNRQDFNMVDNEDDDVNPIV